MLPRLEVDLAVMTGNVAQVFTGDEEWLATLRAVRAALRPGGRMVFETREPAAEAWRSWNRRESRRQVRVPGVGVVDHWVDTLVVDGPLVSFRWTYVFESDGAVLTSESALRFRTREEVEQSIAAAELVVDEVRGAPDRPGLEMVFFCRR
jgi:hypothetical protein